MLLLKKQQLHLIKSKQSKAATDYRLVDTAGENCKTCKYRVYHKGDEHATCTLVTGTVDPQHVCDLWEAQPLRLVKYSPDQPRDADGRFGSGGGERAKWEADRTEQWANFANIPQEAKDEMWQEKQDRDTRHAAEEKETERREAEEKATREADAKAWAEEKAAVHEDISPTRWNEHSGLGLVATGYMPTDNIRHSMNVPWDGRTDYIHEQIQQNGFDPSQPISVEYHGGALYMAGDGNHRLDAARDLGIKEVPVVAQDWTGTIKRDDPFPGLRETELPLLVRDTDAISSNAPAYWNALSTSKISTLRLVKAFDDSEERDSHGRWVSIGEKVDPANVTNVKDLTNGGQMNNYIRTGEHNGIAVIMKGSPDMEEFQHELLASSVGKAMGAPIPESQATGPLETTMPLIEGRTAIEEAQANGSGAMVGGWVQNNLMDRPGSRELGLFDHIAGVADRNLGNVMVTPEGHLVGIDHGNAMHEYGADSRWADKYIQTDHTGEVTSHDYSKEELAALREPLMSTRPDFEALGQVDAHDEMMVRYQQLVDTAT